MNPTLLVALVIACIGSLPATISAIGTLRGNRDIRRLAKAIRIPGDHGQPIGEVVARVDRVLVEHVNNPHAHEDHEPAMVPARARARQRG